MVRSVLKMSGHIYDTHILLYKHSWRSRCWRRRRTDRSVTTSWWAGITGRSSTARGSSASTSAVHSTADSTSACSTRCGMSASVTRMTGRRDWKASAPPATGSSSGFVVDAACRPSWTRPWRSGSTASRRGRRPTTVRRTPSCGTTVWNARGVCATRRSLSPPKASSRISFSTYAVSQAGRYRPRPSATWGWRWPGTRDTTAWHYVSTTLKHARTGLRHVLTRSDATFIIHCQWHGNIVNTLFFNVFLIKNVDRSLHK